MPLLTLSTNLTIPTGEQSSLLETLSAHTARMLGKPESYVMVLLRTGQAMAFGGSPDPCALLELKSLGLPEERSGEFSASLCDLVSDQTGVPASRIYIEFSSPARHLWGWDRSTFG